MRKETLSKIRTLIGADNTLTPRERSFWEGATASPASWELPRLMKASEVAEAIGVSTSRVRAYAKQGLLKSVNPSGRRRAGYTEESVRAFLSGDTSEGGAR